MVKDVSSKGQRASQMVTLKLMSGAALDGYLRGFSSQSDEVPLLREDAEGKWVEERLPAQNVCYIGQHHQQDVPADGYEELEELKVTTVHHEAFHVYMYPASKDALGFFAVSQNKFTPYHRIFFYKHGVHSKEHAEKLGDLLIRENLASPDEVDAALKMQQESKPQLGALLKEQGKLTYKDIQQALEKQRQKDVRLGDILLKKKLVTSERLEEALEEQLVTHKPLGTMLVESGDITSKELLTALHLQKHQKLKLGEILLEAGLITQSDLQQALDLQKYQGLKLGQILLNQKVITEDKLLGVLAKKFRLPCVDLDHYPLNVAVASEINQDIVEKFRVLPIQSDQYSLTIALADPLGLEAYDQICFATGKKIHEVMVKGSQLEERIELFFKEQDYTEELDCEFLSQDAGDVDEDYSDLAMSESAKDAPIVRLVNRIISNALKKEASDIHILPQNHKVILAYRLNGQLISESSLDKHLHAKLAARIKILSGMDISERRMPQDGRLILRDGSKTYEFRVSCIPNAYGESMVLRVLNKSMAVDLNMLGLRDVDIQHLAGMARKPYGLILVTGPTGSGKSTTLFAVLKSLSDLPVHILTIEDPVESEIEDANQIQVNATIGLTFARVLRNVLRHDPDVIMIGEMRDAETAAIGIEAALTGHLMLSTLHTNSAVDTIIRLNDLNIPNYLIAPALLGVLSQNLLKKVCLECRELLPQGDEGYQQVAACGFGEASALYRAVGCQHCHQTGYSGRVMSYEFLVINDAVRQAIHDGVNGAELQKVAVASGMQSKAETAFKLAADGVVDYKDFLYSVM